MHALKSAPLRKQHESLRKHIANLRKHFNPLLLSHGAGEVRVGLTQIFGELGRHLQQETKVVYPPLAESGDVTFKETAERFALEMKQNLPRLAEFNRRWPSAQAIRAEGTLFLKEADAVLQWLERRFIAENNELYPLLDKLDATTLMSHHNPELKISRL